MNIKTHTHSQRERGERGRSERLKHRLTFTKRVNLSVGWWGLGLGGDRVSLKLMEGMFMDG